MKKSNDKKSKSSGNQSYQDNNNNYNNQDNQDQINNDFLQEIPNPNVNGYTIIEKMKWHDNVYKALDKKDNSICAIRVTQRLHSSPEINAQQLDEFLYEINILDALVDQPEVINYRHYSITENQLALVMEEYEMSLLDLIIQFGFFNEKFSQNITKQILEAVRLMNQKQIAHRNLSLKNILFTQDSKIKIVDFQSAVKLQNIDQILKIEKSSLQYMAPEVFLTPYTIQAQSWSIGVIVYAILTGRFPYPLPKSAQDIYTHLKTNGISFLEDEKQRSSKSSRKFIRKLLRKKLAKRLTVIQAQDDNWLYQNNGAAHQVN